MKLSRRGLFGLFGGAAVAATGAKVAEAEPKYEWTEVGHSSEVGFYRRTGGLTEALYESDFGIMQLSSDANALLNVMRERGHITEYAPASDDESHDWDDYS